ncbi:hypothetical protein V6N13_124639 [Hibiscus sabdariffa]
MVGRRARKRLGGAANDSITKFPISGKVPLEWLMHRSASPSPGHAQSVGGVRDPYSANPLEALVMLMHDLVGSVLLA